MARRLWMTICVLFVTQSFIVLPTILRGEEIPNKKKLPDKLNIGLPKTLFRNIPNSALQIANRPFLKIIQDQIGLEGNVVNNSDAMQMAKQMDDQELHLGVFQGFEFARAQARYPSLTPLVIAIPTTRDTLVYIVTLEKSTISNVTALHNQAISIPGDAKDHVLLYWDKLVTENRFKKNSYTVHKGSSSNDSLHEVFDGVVGAAVVDSAAYESFKAFNPGRAKKLKILNQSPIFPPAVIAYRKDFLSKELVKKCRDGLTDASKNQQAKFMLQMIKVQGFEDVPETFVPQLKQSIEHYPEATIERISFDLYTKK